MAYRLLASIHGIDPLWGRLGSNGLSLRALWRYDRAAWLDSAAIAARAAPAASIVHILAQERAAARRAEHKSKAASLASSPAGLRWPWTSIVMALRPPHAKVRPRDGTRPHKTGIFGRARLDGVEYADRRHTGAAARASS